MEKDISSLIGEFRAIIDDFVRELLTFEDADLAKEGLMEIEWGRSYRTLRASIEEWLDEVQVHTGQIQGARFNVAYRRVFGADLDALPPDHLRNMGPVRQEDPWGIGGRTHISRLAGEMYIAGHQLLAQFIGVDDSLMEEPSRPEEWSGKQVLEHLVRLFTPEFLASNFGPYRKESPELPT